MWLLSVLVPCPCPGGPVSLPLSLPCLAVAFPLAPEARWALICSPFVPLSFPAPRLVPAPWSSFPARLSPPLVPAVPGLLPSVAWVAGLFPGLPVLVPAAASSSLPFLPAPAALFGAPGVSSPLSPAAPPVPGSPVSLLLLSGCPWWSSRSRGRELFALWGPVAGFGCAVGPVPSGGCLKRKEVYHDSSI